MSEARIGMLVWFRAGRMYGYPASVPMRGMICAIRDNGRVDIELGCQGISETSGYAMSIAHRDSLAEPHGGQYSCWWDDPLGGTTDAARSSE